MGGEEEEVDAANDGDKDDGRTAAGSNEGNAGEAATDDDLVLASPPHDYFPVGFVFFLTRGPMAEPNHRISSLDLDNMLDFLSGQGRKSHRAQLAQETSAARDYDNGSTTDPRQQRAATNSWM